ncbi:hypothetical protein TNCV_4604121 [Trichonephila clavipes]|nr:hypothetical protein TNCV_4604121 [Trichonephila clavipes]
MTPGLAPTSPNFHTTPTRRRLSLDTFNVHWPSLHGGSLMVLGSNSWHACHESATLTTRLPQPNWKSLVEMKGPKGFPRLETERSVARFAKENPEMSAIKITGELKQKFYCRHAFPQTMFEKSHKKDLVDKKPTDFISLKSSITDEFSKHGKKLGT